MLSATNLRRLQRHLQRDQAEPGLDRNRSRGGRRAAGAYFTPAALVDFVVAETLRARMDAAELRWRDDGSPELIVLDPAAGDGRFLLGAREQLAARAAERGFDRERAAAAITRRCLVGIERDIEFAAAARARLGDGAVVHCREALLDPPSGLPPADIVIGNPPYQRSIHFAQNDSELWQLLRGKFAATSYGEWDLYAAFIERALDWMGPRGHTGLIVPSRWLTASFARKLRAKLADRGAVRAVVDFGAEQLFDGATTYVSLVFLSNQRSAQITVAKHLRADWHCGPVPLESLGSAPWQLATGKRRALLDRLSRAAPSLGDVAQIVKGAGTNADRVYIFEQTEPVGDRIRAFSKSLDRTIELEPDLLRPCLRGRDIGNYEPQRKTHVLVPYTQDGALIEPATLATNYPQTATYLRKNQANLNLREHGRFKGPTFYRWGRPQNMEFLGAPDPKIVVPDVARGGRAILDTHATMIMDSAYALRPAEATRYTLELLLAILNSPIVELWLSETGIPLRGNYLRLKTAYLRSLPLPRLSARTDEIQRAVKNAAAHSTIDCLVQTAYQIPDAHWPCEPNRRL